MIRPLLFAAAILIAKPVIASVGRGSTGAALVLHKLTLRPHIVGLAWERHAQTQSHQDKGGAL